MRKILLFLLLLLPFAGGCGVDSGSEPILPSGVSASSVSAGDFHTCALYSDGTVRCWGSNGAGQIGDGSTVDTPIPMQAAGIANADQVSAGGAHTCALLSSGAIMCWGLNTNGQLGNGSTTDSFTPVPVSGVSTATQVSAGRRHTCARFSDGTVSCWGFNASGQLGDGTTSNASTPVRVTGITTAVAVTTGDSHSCALLSDGSINCWGSSSLDQLGNGTILTGAHSSTPVAVNGISTASAIDAGSSHTCAALSTGGVRCWGDNISGQLGALWGLSSTIPPIALTSSRTPTFVSGISTAAGVAGGFVHSCAVLTDKTVQCWGDNANGQLGNGNIIGFVPPGPGAGSTSTIIPVQAAGIGSATSVTAGLFHTCARLSDGRIDCWGLNTSGQLGIGTTISSTTPVEVLH